MCQLTLKAFISFYFVAPPIGDKLNNVDKPNSKNAKNVHILTVDDRKDCSVRLFHEC